MSYTNCQLDSMKLWLATALLGLPLKRLICLADTLEKTGDRNEMNQLKNRALKIRAAFNDKESHTDRTPYGTQCEKS